MTNAYELRNHFFLEDYNTAITREDFESFFTKTKEKVTFTFGGWDGKSYDGESRRATVYRTTVKGYEDVRLIKVGKAKASTTSKRTPRFWRRPPANTTREPAGWWTSEGSKKTREKRITRSAAPSGLYLVQEVAPRLAAAIFMPWRTL